MISNYEMVFKYLNSLASESNDTELEFPKNERINYYVQGDGVSMIDAAVFEIGFYDGEYIKDLEGLKFFFALGSLEIYPEYERDNPDSDDILHIKAKVIEF